MTTRPRKATEIHTAGCFNAPTRVDVVGFIPRTLPVCAVNASSARIPAPPNFNGDDGSGLGAAHQTGWTAMVVDLICGESGADPAEGDSTS